MKRNQWEQSATAEEMQEGLETTRRLTNNESSLILMMGRSVQTRHTAKESTCSTVV